jgi:hypothetical protein
VKRRLRILEIAKREVREARRYYERQRPGLGGELFEEFDRVANLIERNPEAYQIIHNDVRHVVLRRFDYIVYFRIEGALVVLTGFMHSRRDPARWLER